MKFNLPIHLCDLPHDDVVDELVDATDNVTFAYEGTRYSLDVCDTHKTAVRTVFEELIALADAQRQTIADQRPKRRSNAAAIRAWAAANGIELSGRGRIPSAVKDAFTHAATTKVTDS